MMAVSRVLKESPIAGTPFAPTGACYGASYGSDGHELRAFLGVEEEPDPEEGVSLTLEGGTRLSIPLDADLRTRREEPPSDETAASDKDSILVVAAPASPEPIKVPRHREESRMAARRCPKCGSKNVARIMYGLPIMTNPRLQQQLKIGKVTLGGCVFDPSASPSHHCNACEHEWRVPTKAEQLLDGPWLGDSDPGVGDKG